MNSKVIGGIVAVGATAAAVLLDRSPEHNDVLANAYQTVARETDEAATVYVDHLDVDAPNPRDAEPGDDKVPDLVVSQFEGRQLVVEVETEDSLNEDALVQLEDFATTGYTRALVVPEETTSKAAAFIRESRLQGEVSVTCSENISRFL